MTTNSNKPLSLMGLGWSLDSIFSGAGAWGHAINRRAAGAVSTVAKWKFNGVTIKVEMRLERDPVAGSNRTFFVTKVNRSGTEAKRAIRYIPSVLEFRRRVEGNSEECPIKTTTLPSGHPANITVRLADCEVEDLRRGRSVDSFGRLEYRSSVM